MDYYKQPQPSEAYRQLGVGSVRAALRKAMPCHAIVAIGPSKVVGEDAKEVCGGKLWQAPAYNTRTTEATGTMSSR